MKNEHNFIGLEGPYFGAFGALRLIPALTFCRQVVGSVRVFVSPAPLRRLGLHLTRRLDVYEDGGAVERVLLLQIWALCRLVCFGLLQGMAMAVQSISTAITRAAAGLDQTDARDAGAFQTSRPTGDLQAFYRALLSVRGGLLPSQPCMNELPSHAQNIYDRLMCPVGLCVDARSTGF